jgi:hypothetical protein
VGSSNYHSPNFVGVGVRSLILRHSLNTSLFHIHLSSKALEPVVQRIARNETLARDGTSLVGVDPCVMLLRSVVLDIILAHFRRWVALSVPGSREIGRFLKRKGFEGRVDR